MRFKCQSSLQGFSPPLYPPPEASAIPPPGCFRRPFPAPRRLPDGVQDELDFKIVLETLSGRISAPSWPPRGPLMASQIDSRGPRERLFGPTTRTNWKLQKHRKTHWILMILASPGVARTRLLADFRACLGYFSVCQFRRLFWTRSRVHFGRLSAQLGPPNGPQNSPESAWFLLQDGRGCRPTRGCSRLGPPEARLGRLGPVLGPFGALLGALFGPSWRLLGRFRAVFGWS